MNIKKAMDELGEVRGDHEYKIGMAIAPILEGFCEKTGIVEYRVSIDVLKNEAIGGGGLVDRCWVVKIKY